MFAQQPQNNIGYGDNGSDPAVCPDCARLGLR